MPQKAVLGPVKQSFIPLITGMLAVEGLGVQGLPVIPVYLITAETTRKVIDQLERDLQRVGPAQSLEQFSKHTSQQAVSENSKSTQVDLVDPQIASSPAVPWQVVHAIPGRIRFRVARITHDRAYARRLERLAKLDLYVEKVRVNRAAASIAITYQAGKVSDDEMQFSLARLIQAASEVVPPMGSTIAVMRSTTLETHYKGAVPIDSTVAAAQPLTQKQVSPVVSDTEVTHCTSAIAAIHRSPSSESVSLWADLKPPALSVMLAFMANLV